ncbi:unnamed protein product [Mytilus edulis]|uniref:Rubisco LSMT substrate-binding domain-containing protein n=1 Tax=Mytilus edulis TaxID=6550 RepID=A0A8S3URV7_MYTED|nr:unnamed protein product [Mytilus edulis]
MISGGKGIKQDGANEVMISRGKGIKQDGANEVMISRGKGIKQDKANEVMISGDGANEVMISGGKGIKQDGANEVMISRGKGIKQDQANEVMISRGKGIKQDQANEVMISRGKGIKQDGANEVMISRGKGIKQDGANEVMISRGKGIKQDKANEVMISREQSKGIKQDGANEVMISRGKGIKQDKANEVMISRGKGIKQDGANEVMISRGKGIKQDQANEVEAGFNKNNNCFEIKTYNSFRKYDQVFISYGAHSNTHLLMEYGFILPDNPHDVYELDYDEIVRVAQNLNLQYIDRKKRIIEENNINRKLVCSKEGVSWSMHAVMKILAMDFTELKSWKLIFKDDQISVTNQKAVEQMGHILLQQELLELRSVFVKFPSKDKSRLTPHQNLALDLLKIEENILQQSIKL